MPHNLPNSITATEKLGRKHNGSMLFHDSINACKGVLRFEPKTVELLLAQENTS